MLTVRLALTDDEILQRIDDEIGDPAWGAIKSWQMAHEDRPQINRIDVTIALNEWLRSLPPATEVKELEPRALLAVMKRDAAAIYLQ